MSAIIFKPTQIKNTVLIKIDTTYTVSDLAGIGLWHHGDEGPTPVTSEFWIYENAACSFVWY